MKSLCHCDIRYDCVFWKVTGTHSQMKLTSPELTRDSRSNYMGTDFGLSTCQYISLVLTVSLIHSFSDLL